MEGMAQERLDAEARDRMILGFQELELSNDMGNRARGKIGKEVLPVFVERVYDVMEEAAVREDRNDAVPAVLGEVASLLGAMMVLTLDLIIDIDKTPQGGDEALESAWTQAFREALSHRRAHGEMLNE